MNIGDRVVVNNLYTGTVRYMGRVGTKKTVSLGIELDTPNGTNNGSLMGKFYFACKPRHGVFKDPAEVKRYRAEEYNQTGLLTDGSLLSWKESGEDRQRINQLLQDRLGHQSALECLKQENLKLEVQLAEEKRKRAWLEQTLKQTEEKVARLSEGFASTASLSDAFLDGASGGRTPQAIILDLINEVKHKIEAETGQFPA